MVNTKTNDKINLKKFNYYYIHDKLMHHNKNPSFYEYFF